MVVSGWPLNASLDRMVTITSEAIAKIEKYIASAGAEPMDWFVIVSWRKGAADNRRTADGAVAWNIAPDEGWVAEPVSWAIGKVPREDGVPLFGDVRLLVQSQFAPEPFHGGEIYVEGGQLKVKRHAI